MFKPFIAAVLLLCSSMVAAAEYWIDVRIPEQYQSQHIQGAINIPLQHLKEEIAQHVQNKNDTLYLYCNSGRQSGLAKQALLDMGYTNVFNVGGISRIDKPKVEQ